MNSSSALEALKRKFEESARTDAVVDEKRRTRGREIGTVEAYDRAKGWGFIVDADREKIFVHQSQIISPGFRCLEESQKVSFLRGENNGKPWAEDVRDPDGAPIAASAREEPSEGSLAKKRRQQLKEQWRNFFDIPQYALKGHGESLPVIASNEDAFLAGETVPQLGKLFVIAKGCCATTRVGNEATRFVKEKAARFVGKSYEDKGDSAVALASAFDSMEAEFMERAKMKSLTDGAEVMLCLFVHALNASGQPCVQLWTASAGTLVGILCDTEGRAARINEPHATKGHGSTFEKAGFKVLEDGAVEVAFAEVGDHRPSSMFRLPSTRLIGGRPFKTAGERSPVHARAKVQKAKEWRCVAGEELFMLVCSSEVLSVLSDQDVVNAALDVWGGNAEQLDGWEAAAKAVVRTAQAQGPASDKLACFAVQFWWQEKPLQRLLARRAERLRSGEPAVVEKKPVENDGFDMFG